MNFENKVVVITGGTRGIGFATAKSFAENGASVILFGSKKETVDHALNELKTLGLNGRTFCPNKS